MDDATRKLMSQVATVLVTLAAERTGRMPATLLYLALGTDIGAMDRLVSIMRGAGLIEATARELRLTAKGRARAERLVAVGIG